MSISFENQKSIKKILKGTDKEIMSNIDLLAKDYKEKTMDDMEKMFMYNKGEFDKIYNVLINRNN